MKELDIQNYFKSEKNDWYTTDKNGKKQWDFEKVNLFWDRFANYFSNHNYVSIWIEEFIFPEFTREALKIFDREERHSVSFNKCKFLGNVSLRSKRPSDGIRIAESIFYESIRLSMIDCESLLIAGNFFFKSFNLSSQQIKTLVISDSVFNEGLTLNRVSVEYKLRIERVILYKSLEVNDLNDMSTGRYYFNDITALDESQISVNQFITLRKFIAQDRMFKYLDGIDKIKMVILGHYNGKNKILTNNFASYVELKRALNFFYVKESRTEPPKLIFESSNLNDKVYFNSINFSNTEFVDSKLIHADFGECDWNVKRGRLLLSGEAGLSFKQSESNYRQLKRNFSQIKYWELSGYAYVSEMEMRKKRLWSEKKYFEWVIYAFYGYFGGYTQNIKKPIFSIIGLIIVFTIIYYFIDYSLVKALQRGIKGALPYIQIDTKNPFTGYWLIAKNFQFLLGGTFITFFILALRKRFKQ